MHAAVVSQLSYKMHVFEKSYYKINRFFLKALGLWPYQQSYFVRIQKVLLMSILLSFLIVQLLVFVTTQYNTNFLLKVLTYVFCLIFVIIKYYIFVIQTDNVKELLDQIQNDWDSLKDKMEIDIVKKYAHDTRFLTISMTVFLGFGTILLTILQFLPKMLDVISPLNESRPLRLFVAAEYFIDQEKYFYPVLIHEVLSGFVGAAVLCSTGTTIMLYIYHACALFKIASYRIENAIKESILAMSTPKKEYLLYQRVVRAIIIHQRATEFIEFLTSTFMAFYTILIIVGVCSLSLNLFQLLQVLILMDNTSEIFIFASFIIAHLMYIYFLNCGGQKITDHGINLFKATYNGLWYIAPLQTQKLLLFIMQKETRSINLTCLGMFVASLEGCATLLSMAVSYFTVIYSTR